MGGDRRFLWLILLTRQFLIKLIMLLKGGSERGQGRWGERSGALALEKEAERLLRPQSCSLQGRRLGLAGIWSSRVPVLSLPLPKGGPGGSSPYSSLPAALLGTPSLPCLLCDPQVPENSRIFRPPSLTNVYPPHLVPSPMDRRGAPPATDAEGAERTHLSGKGFRSGLLFDCHSSPFL